MKTFMMACLASFFLSGAAIAQEDWIFIRCDFETRQVGPWLRGEDAQADAAWAIFRFNATEVAAFSGSEMRWYSFCESDETFDLGAACTVTPEEVAVVRNGHGIREDRSVNRLNGRYTMRQRYDGSADGFDSEGSCVPTTDPTAGQRRF
jgi:hypothetical protein